MKAVGDAGPGQEDQEGGRREEAVLCAGPCRGQDGGVATRGVCSPLGSRRWRCQLGLLLAARASAGGEAQPTPGAASRS